MNKALEDEMIERWPSIAADEMAARRQHEGEESEKWRGYELSKTGAAIYQKIGDCWFTNKDAMELTGYSYMAVIYGLRSLVTSGLIEKKIGHRNTSVYRRTGIPSADLPSDYVEPNEVKVYACLENGPAFLAELDAALPDMKYHRIEGTLRKMLKDGRVDREKARRPGYGRLLWKWRLK